MCVIAIFIVMLSLIYDVVINSTYRIFLVDDDACISIIRPTAAGQVMSSSIGKVLSVNKANCERK